MFTILLNGKRFSLQDYYNSYIVQVIQLFSIPNALIQPPIASNTDNHLFVIKSAIVTNAPLFHCVISG